MVELELLLLDADADETGCFFFFFFNFLPEADCFSSKETCIRAQSFH